MSDLSELDNATIDIETAVRRELPEPQKVQSKNQDPRLKE